MLRDGREQAVLARELVPGDVLLIEEGDRVSADARLLDGAVDVDMSTLTGESLPVSRSVRRSDTHVPLLHARDLRVQRHHLHRGHGRRRGLRDRRCTPSWAASRRCSQRVGREESPLERQVRRVAWLIAVVAVGVGAGVPAARPAGAG